MHIPWRKEKHAPLRPQTAAIGAQFTSDVINADERKISTLTIVECANNNTTADVVIPEIVVETAEVTTKTKEQERLEALRALLDSQIAKNAAMTLLESSPNVFTHYQTVNIGLENIFIGCKAVTSVAEKRTGHSGQLDHANLVLEIVEKVISLVPIFGDLADLVIKGVKEVLWSGKYFLVLDDKRQINKISNVGYMGTLADMSRISENVARKLSEHHFHKLHAVVTAEDEEIVAIKAKATIKGKAKAVVHSAVSTVTCSNKITTVQQIGNFAVAQFLGALLDGAIDGKGSSNVEDQLLKVLTTPPSKKDMVRSVFLHFLGKNLITLKTGEKISLEDFYRTPGPTPKALTPANRLLSISDPGTSAPRSISAPRAASAPRISSLSPAPVRALQHSTSDETISTAQLHPEAEKKPRRRSVQKLEVTEIDGQGMLRPQNTTTKADDNKLQMDAIVSEFSQRLAARQSAIDLVT